MYNFYTLQNDIKPHCVKCHAVVKDDSQACMQFHGIGAERKRCGGAIEKDLYLDWSTNFLKNYSIMEAGDLSVYEACWVLIQEQLDEAKGNKSKVHIQREIERFMRQRGVDLINRIDGTGEMHTTSRYKIPAGKSKVTDFAYEDLKGRFERKPTDPNDPEKEDGFMKFTPIVAGEEDKAVEEVPESFVCDECGFKAKAAIGLRGHQRTHDKKKTTGK